MEPQESVAFSLLLSESLKGKENRKRWVLTINAVRHHDGHFYTLYTPVQENPAKFF
jgi:hypothetical protein